MDPSLPTYKKQIRLLRGRSEARVQTDICIRDSSIPLHPPKPKTKLVLDIQAVGKVRSLSSRPSIIDSRDCFPRARCSIYRASRRGNLFDMSVLFRIAPAVCLCYSRASVWSNRRRLPPTGNESSPPGVAKYSQHDIRISKLFGIPTRFHIFGNI
jgi:hypothetical protein